MESCLGIGGMVLKFEEKCTWAEQIGKMSGGWQGADKIHMVIEAAHGFDSLG